MKKKLYRFLRNKTQNKFLNYFVECGTISRAAKAAGIDRSTHYYWMQDSLYQLAYAKAKEMARDLIEEEAWRRGVYGDERPMFYKGEQVGTVKHYSDALLALLLKGNFPDKYKDRIEQETVGDGSSMVTWEGGEPDAGEDDETGGPEADSDTVPAGEALAGDDTPQS